MLKHFRVGIALLVLASSIATAADLKIAVLPLKPGPGVDQKTADLLTENLVAEIQNRVGKRVLSAHEIEATLGFERQRQLLGCSEQSQCLTEIGGALGVDELVLGSIGRLGASLIINLQRVNMRTGITERRYSKRVHATSDEAFLDAVSAAASDLYAPEKTAQLDMPPPPKLKELKQSAPPPPPPNVTTTESSSGPGRSSWEAGVRGQWLPSFLKLGALSPGGAVVVYGGYQILPELDVKLGFMTSLTDQGAWVKGTWTFLPGGTITPTLGLEVPVLFTALTLGPGLTPGVELIVTPWLSLALEVPIYFLPVVPANNPTFWVFGALSATAHF